MRCYNRVVVSILTSPQPLLRHFAPFFQYFDRTFGLPIFLPWLGSGDRFKQSFNNNNKKNPYMNEWFNSFVRNNQTMSRSCLSSASIQNCTFVVDIIANVAVVAIIVICFVPIISYVHNFILLYINIQLTCSIIRNAKLPTIRRLYKTAYKQCLLYGNRV